jgi:hypothetical protein
MSAKRCAKMSFVTSVSGRVLSMQQLVVHADDERLFVVRPVEDADATPLGEAALTAPQEIVVELFRGRRP